MSAQVANNNLLLVKLCVEELEIALEFRLQPLVRVAHKVSFVLHTLLESFHYVSLNVVGVELSLRLLVLIIVLSDVLVHPFFLALNSRLYAIVHLLLLRVFSFNFSEFGSQRAQFLDLRRQSVLLVLALSVNLLHEGGEFLEGLAFDVVKLLFELGDALDLVFDVGVALDALLLFEALEEVVDVARAVLEDLLCAVEDSDLSLDFVESFLHLLVVVVFHSKGGGVLLEVVALQVLASTNFLVSFLFFPECFL